MRPLLLLALIGCRGDKAGDEAAEDAASSLEVWPPSAGQGVTLEVDLDASSSFFSFSDTQVSFGDGVEVVAVNVDDGWGARAQITIEPDAELGARDVTVTSDGREYTVEDGFTVISQSFEIDPGAGMMGETLEVDVLGHNTAWASGRTWPHFGDGVEVLEFTVLSETLAQATISISPDALPGWRNVTMDSGGDDYVVLYDGFQVDRVALTAEFDPATAAQGDTVEFTVYARNTDFLAGTPQIKFFDAYGENPDVVVQTLTVLDAENLHGKMSLSNAAALGDRDVLIQTGEEGVLIPDAFEVTGGGWALDQVAVSLSFSVSRDIDNATGAISESVNATCVFFIPLNPGCPEDPEAGSDDCVDGVDNDDDTYIDCEDDDCSTSGVCPSPMPYDNNLVTQSPQNGSVDCPFPQTVPAGDFVWLESDANVITLEKQVDTSTGTIYYAAIGLTIEDYVVDNWYDLHTQGEEGAIPEYLVEDVLPTVPSDWTWISPPLWGNYTHDRDEDYAFEWTPAMTYPDAMFYVGISGTLVDPEGWPGSAGVLPWDDGIHAFTPAELTLLAEGGAYVSAASSIKGPEFGLPDSVYQTNQASSSISLTGYVILE